MPNPDVTPDGQRDVASNPGDGAPRPVPAAPDAEVAREATPAKAAEPAASDVAPADSGEAPADAALAGAAPADGGPHADAPNGPAPSVAASQGEPTAQPWPSDDAGDAGDAEPLSEAERQRDAYLDALRRERAEFENFRRRSAKERAEALDRGAERLIDQLLGVLDNFGYVLDAAKDSSDDALAKGAQMVHSELLGVLERAGLEIVPGVGEPFDPIHHEAVMQVEAPEPVEHPVVADVLRPGYRFKDRVLRPASVSVAQ